MPTTPSLPEYGYYADRARQGMATTQSRNTATTANRRKWLTTASRRSSLITATACGYYAEPPDYGYYGEQPEMGEYEPPVGYYAEEQPVGGYAQAPEMVGYREYEPLSEAIPKASATMASQTFGLREGNGRAPVYNPGCPMPTNVAGFAEAEPYAEAEPFAGYQRPDTVNPSCAPFTPQPGITEPVPETFKPLW